MNNNGYINSADAVYAEKAREKRVTEYCDIFKGIIRECKLFLYAQVVVYLIMAYLLFWVILGAKDLFQPLVSVMFPVAALAVTVVKRDMKGNLIGLGTDVVSIAAFLYLHVMDAPVMVLLLASLIIHGVRAEKIYCHERIKELYGYSRFSSFDICNQILGESSYADGIIADYESVFDNELMKYERTSHYVSPKLKKIQTAAAAAVIAGIVALVISSSVMGKIKGAQSIDSIGNKTGGSVKGSVTQIFDVSGIGTDSLTDDEYWVTFGGEQVLFVVPGPSKSDFEALMRFQHPEKFDPDLSGDVKASDKPVEFVGEIVKADDGKYSDDKITVAKQQKDKSSLPFNTKYYIRIYNTSFFGILQKIGIILFVLGAAAWAGVIVMENLESRRY